MIRYLLVENFFFEFPKVFLGFSAVLDEIILFALKEKGLLGVTGLRIQPTQPAAG